MMVNEFAGAINKVIRSLYYVGPERQMTVHGRTLPYIKDRKAL